VNFNATLEAEIEREGHDAEAAADDVASHLAGRRPRECVICYKG
jgi:hypothetical protein